MRWFLTALLKCYRAILSPLFTALGGRCRFYPTCSEYALEAVSRLPLSRALPLVAWRVLRCGPWTSGGVDPVPGAGLL